MKRRAPTIWAAVAALVVAGLVHREGKLQKQRDRAAAAAEEAQTSDLKESEEDEKDDDGEASLADLAARPKASAGALPLTTQFHTMPDGTPVPALSPTAPDRIKLGVVLFRYKGAQGSSESTRSRDAAEALAKEAAELAQKDFAAAVKKGDHGSHENIGWMKQRVLERAVEYAVFSLEKGETTKTPVDTPRGFWVAKRLR